MVQVDKREAVTNSVISGPGNFIVSLPVTGDSCLTFEWQCFAAPGRHAPSLKRFRRKLPSSSGAASGWQFSPW